MLLHKDSYEPNILRKCHSWVFICIESLQLIVGSVYIKPSGGKENEDTFQELERNIQEISQVFYNYTILIGGDFNGRIGLKNQCDWEIFAGVETQLSYARCSLDSQENAQGKILLKIMEDAGFIVLNGRSPSDHEGQFTCLTHNGKSTPDTVWVNLAGIEHVADFYVSEVFLQSDHFPITALLGKRSTAKKKPKPKGKSEIRNLKWSKEITDTYVHEMLKTYKSYTNSVLSVEQKSTYLVNSITNVANKISSMHNDPNVMYYSFRNPWFDASCKTAKYKMRNAYRKCKRKKFTVPEDVSTFLENKKFYKDLIREKRQTFITTLQSKLSTVKDSCSFWKAVGFFKSSKFEQSSIDKEQVHQHFSQLFSLSEPHSIECAQLLHSSLHPVLDKPISSSELNLVLKRCSNGKAAGSDGLTYEVYKRLPECWRENILELFNEIFNDGNLPPSWPEIVMFLIFKKGDKSCISNYRGISLINTIVKIFTYIIYLRLEKFCEDNKILPENQAGFRRNRGCIDHVFTLSSTVNFVLQQPKSKVFLSFIDYRFCFDKINHSLLFAKLKQIGISLKIINVLSILYLKAHFRVKIDDGSLTEEINITNGILQGDTLSPLLFDIFVSDFESHLQGTEGVIISDQNIQVLFYADDLVLISQSVEDMQRKLDILSKYSDENKMEVNVAKSKVMVCRRGGRLGKNCKFSYKNEPLEIVNKFKYLGLIFSSSGLFLQAAEDAVRKGMLAINRIKQIILNSKVFNLATWEKLFESVVSATTLYGSEVWGFRYLDQLEKVQVRFYKTMLFLASNTPNHLIKKEFTIRNIKTMWLQRTLNWWLKLLAMENTRFPKICYNLFKNDFTLCLDKYNWCLQLEQVLVDTGFGFLWREENPRKIKENISHIIDTYQSLLRQNEQLKIEDSKFNTFYKVISNLGNPPATVYFNQEFTNSEIRFLAQLRLACEGLTKLSLRDHKLTFSLGEPCELCQENLPHTMHHFFCHCIFFNDLRQKIWYKTQLSLVSFIEFLTNPTPIELKRYTTFFLSGADMIPSPI